nr:undifferentiated embryonic cell transcription factor 1 [Vulpes vulpes]
MAEWLILGLEFVKYKMNRSFWSHCKTRKCGKRGANHEKAPGRPKYRGTHRTPERLLHVRNVENKSKKLPGSRGDSAPFRAPGSPPPPSLDREDPESPPRRPEHHAPPQAAAPSLNTALLQTLGHLGDIVAILGPLRDQLLTLNQHVEQLRGSFDQTVSLAVGFILGSAAASERGVLADLRE